VIKSTLVDNVLLLHKMSTCMEQKSKGHL